MNRTNLTLGAAIIVVGAASFVAGRMSGDREQADDPQSAALPTKSQRSGGSAASSGPDRDRASRGANATASAGQPELLSGMRGALDQADPVSRTRAWLDFIDQLSNDEFLDVITAFRDGGVPEDRMGEYAMLLSAWARMDPIAALDYAKDNTGSSFARQTVLATWATSDPDAALRWAEANHEGEGANPWLVGVIRGLAGHDAARATDIMRTMPFSRERGEALSAILPKILEQGGDVAREWAMAIEDERLRDGAIRRIAEKLASTDPAGTADWLVSNPGEAASRTMDDVFSSWVKTDDSAAKSYFQTLPAGDARTNALRGIVNAMAWESPREAASFLDNHQADATDRVVQQFVWHSFREAPEIAADYIGKIDNENERNRTYSRMLEGWIQRDEPAAMSWMAGNTLPEPVVKHLERRIQERQQRRN